MQIPRHSHWKPVAALTGFAACFVLAADSPADGLLKLRQEWRAQVEKDTRKARDDYADKLAKLEKELAEAGDYAGAGKARRERLKITGAPGTGGRGASTMPPAVTDGEPILLEPAGATLNGGVIFDAPAGILKNWTATGAAAWDLPPGLKSGGYDVELTWSCAPGSGGEMVIKEDRYSMRRAVKPSASWEDFKTEIVGTLRLLSNSRLLELTAATLKGEALLQLKSIRLLPANGRR